MDTGQFADAARHAHRCACNNQPMALVRRMPGVSSFPALRTLRCQQCGRVETIEEKTG